MWRVTNPVAVLVGMVVVGMVVAGIVDVVVGMTEAP
jgi:hypothetical protein